MNDTNATTTVTVSGESMKDVWSNGVDIRSVRFLGIRPYTLSLNVAGGIIIATVLLTCCCTLIVRNKCARFFHKFTGKKKKESVSKAYLYTLFFQYKSRQIKSDI